MSPSSVVISFRKASVALMPIGTVRTTGSPKLRSNQEQTESATSG